MAACGKMLCCPGFKSSKRCTGKEGQCSQPALHGIHGQGSNNRFSFQVLGEMAKTIQKHKKKKNLSNTMSVHKVVETRHKLEKDKGLQEAPRSMCVSHRVVQKGKD